MAFDNAGATWLQDSEEIANPYFGEMMLGCGEIQETIGAVHE
jgi:Cu(I)/Ag(I) efflux system membrane fusion protein